MKYKVGDMVYVRSWREACEVLEVLPNLIAVGRTVNNTHFIDWVPYGSIERKISHPSDSQLQGKEKK
jgi:hypothetical protein